MVFFLIAAAGLAILLIFLALDQRNKAQAREGYVKEVLNKDAFVIEFDDGKSNVVKFHGIKMASENEMLDEQIFKFLYERVRGKRIVVNPNRVANGDVIIGELRALSGEYLNAIMLRQGFGRWNPAEAANDLQLQKAQELAMSEQIGVWNPTVQQLRAERIRIENEMRIRSEESDETPVIESVDFQQKTV